MDTVDAMQTHAQTEEINEAVVYAYSHSLVLPESYDFTAFLARLQQTYSCIIYTKYRFTEQMLDVVSNASIDNPESIVDIALQCLNNDDNNRQNVNSEGEQDAWALLRIERNRRLTECDWTQLSDCPLSVTAKMQWSYYRQMLRNVPQDISDPLNPEWPTIPQST